jgi:hypothetical protein
VTAEIGNGGLVAVEADVDRFRDRVDLSAEYSSRLQNRSKSAKSVSDPNLILI